MLYLVLCIGLCQMRAWVLFLIIFLRAVLNSEIELKMFFKSAEPAADLRSHFNLVIICYC